MLLAVVNCLHLHPHKLYPTRIRPPSRTLYSLPTYYHPITPALQINHQKNKPPPNGPTSRNRHPQNAPPLTPAQQLYRYSSGKRGKRTIRRQLCAQQTAHKRRGSGSGRAHNSTEEAKGVGRALLGCFLAQFLNLQQPRNYLPAPVSQLPALPPRPRPHPAPTARLHHPKPPPNPSPLSASGKHVSDSAGHGVGPTGLGEALGGRGGAQEAREWASSEKGKREAIQQFNKAMNSLNLTAFASRGAQHSFNFSPVITRPQGFSLLDCLALALREDLSRFQRNCLAKIAEQQRPRQPQLPPPSPRRPRSEQPPKKPQSKPPSTSHKSLARPLPIKDSPPTKPHPPVSVPKAPVSAPKPAPPSKKVRVTAAAPVQPKKKIQKVEKTAEPRREANPRVPRINLVETAVLSRARVGEKEMRRLRERLMQRRVTDWEATPDLRRDRRELRTLT